MTNKQASDNLSTLIADIDTLIDELKKKKKLPATTPSQRQKLNAEIGRLNLSQTHASTQKSAYNIAIAAGKAAGQISQSSVANINNALTAVNKAIAATATVQALLASAKTAVQKINQV